MKRRKRSLSKIAKEVLIASLCLGSMPSCQQDTEEAIKPKVEQNITPPKDINKLTMTEAYELGYCNSILSYLEIADIKVDTVILNKDNYNKRIAAGAYLPMEDRVCVKFFIPDITGADSIVAEKIIKNAIVLNDNVYIISNKAHEGKHRDTRKNGAFKNQISAEQYGKISQHNEIASYVSNLLAEREIYMNYSMMGIHNEKYLNSIISPRFSAYRELITLGIINPWTDNYARKNLEDYAILKIVQNWWIEKEQNVNQYVSIQNIEYTGRSHKDFYLRPDNEYEYQKSLEACYTYIKDGKLKSFNFFNIRGEILENQLRASCELARIKYGIKEPLQIEKMQKVQDVDLVENVSNFIETQRAQVKKSQTLQINTQKNR